MSLGQPYFVLVASRPITSREKDIQKWIWIGLVIVVWPFIEVHLHINIVTTILEDMQSSIGILKARKHMAIRVSSVPCGNY